MLSAFLYKPIYYIIVISLTIISLAYYRKRYFNRKKNSHDVVSILVALFMIVFIGFRPNSELFFVDMIGYTATYELNYGKDFIFDWSAYNIIFDNMFLFLASRKFPVEWFFLLISFIYFGGIYWACHKLFGNSSLLALVTYLGAFSTFSYATNGIKAGTAASVFLLAFAYRKNVLISLLFVLLSIGFHHSMPLVAVAFLLTFVIKKPGFYLFFWITCFFLAAFHVTFFMDFFAGFTDEHGAKYLDGEFTDISGFRLDFILYSVVPIMLGWCSIKYNHVQSKIYKMLWNTYTAANGLWLLCTYAAFTNRIAYLSWFMYPIVLLYPFLNISWSRRQYIYLKYVVYGHLAFTLFMFFIYYR
jgi:hypothetical protein